MIRVLTPAVLLAAAALASAPPGSPRAWWPEATVARTVSAGEVRRDGVLVERYEAAISYPGPVVLDSVVVEKSVMHLETFPLDGEPFRGDLVYYHEVDDRACRLAGMHYPDEPLVPWPVEELILQAPLEPGRSWTFTTQQYLMLAEGGAEARFPWTVVVEAVGDTVTVPAGTFTGCLRVRESGRAERPFPVRGAPGRVVEAIVESSAEKWFAPGLGAILTVKRERAYPAAAPRTVWAEWEMKVELSAVERRP